MPDRKRHFVRLIATVKALWPSDWFGAAGDRFRSTTSAVSAFAEEHHVRPSEVLGEAVDLGRRKLEGLANNEFAAAVKNFADAEKLKIEAELQRRSLESRTIKEEADARKAVAEARVAEFKAIEAEVDLLNKLSAIGVVLHRDENGNLKVLPLSKAPGAQIGPKTASAGAE